ncbi:MAG: laccase domain-containing protein [Balneolaceae bacterium]|nr:laccase domain-containing protein [Balneolaceae bacterium]
MKFLHKGTLPTHQRFPEFLRDPRASIAHALVIGEDVSYSYSPRLQQPHWNGLGDQSCPYLAVSVEKSEVVAFKQWLRTSSTVGCNITLPYKQTMVDVASHLSPEAARLGVVNTLKREPDGTLSGHNTDPDGVRYALRSVADHLQGAKVVLFGAGGATSSVCLALEQLGVTHLLIVRRDVGVPWEFESTQCTVEQVSYDQWADWASRHQPALFVNATPLGLKGHYEGQSPVKDHEVTLLEQAIGFDLVYNPTQTPFLSQIQHQGGHPVGGLEMLIGQASASFALWTGSPFQDLERVGQRMAIHTQWDVIEPQWNGVATPKGQVEAQFLTRNQDADARRWLGEGGWTDHAPPSIRALHPQVAWCEQVHGHNIEHVTQGGKYRAPCDGLWTMEPNLTLAIRVADCAAILLADPKTGWMAALHAGWRGAVAGILPRALDIATHQGVDLGTLRGWLSPCIGASAFEVGPEVATQFPEEFVVHDEPDGNPHVDLKSFLVDQALSAGVEPSNMDLDWGACTLTESERYWSYRALGEDAGRMVAYLQNHESNEG